MTILPYSIPYIIILIKAKESNIPINTFCDNQSNYFRSLSRKALKNSTTSKIINNKNFEIYDFIRTTEDRHKKIVTILWNKLKETSYLEESTYSGYYCVSDENFLQLKDLIKFFINIP